MLLCLPALAITAVGVVIQASIVHMPDWTALFIAVFAAVVVDLAGVGAFVAIRVPANPIGWMMSGAGLAAALSFYGGSYAEFAHDVAKRHLPLEVLGAWFGSWLFGPTLGGLALFMLFLFPTGRFLSARWRWGGGLAVLGLLLSFVGMAFTPGPLSSAPWIDNPFGISGEGDWLAVAATVGTALAVPVFVMALASFLVRIRRAGPIEREQLKWFGFPATAWVVLLLLSIATTGALSDALWAVGLVVVAVLPIAIGVAILRYRLWDIDRIVSRTIAYGILTVMLGGLFGLSVVVLEEALASVTAGDTIVVAVSTLGVVFLFAPLRRRVQAWVDRRFDRANVDRAELVAAFGGSTARSGRPRRGDWGAHGRCAGRHGATDSRSVDRRATLTERNPR
jgi:hypothetical protein